ncbi:DNA topoisomerase, partial [Acinetobacter baumannii]
ILKEDGWLGLLKTYSIDENALEYVDGEEDSEKEPEHTLPMDIEVGQNHNVIAGKVIATKTKPRSRYTVPSLVKLLEKKGIGRPSTYQSIFERLIKHGYIKLVKKK